MELRPSEDRPGDVPNKKKPQRGAEAKEQTKEKVVQEETRTAKPTPTGACCAAESQSSLCPFWVTCDRRTRKRPLVHVRYCSESGQIGRRRARSALCQKRTN